jgi:predicted small metal-binding protein
MSRRGYSPKEAVMRELRCRDIGFDCDAVVHADTDEEILAQAAAHAKQVHDVDVTAEQAQQIATLIHDQDGPSR